VSFRYHFSDMVRFWPETENPRVGGSIPPWLPSKTKSVCHALALSSLP
jgi:hypothetical protein